LPSKPRSRANQLLIQNSFGERVIYFLESR
jgi:hypothetical protein